MKPILVFFSIVVAALPVCAQTPAATPAAPAPAASKPASDPDQKMICKTEESTGSRLGGHKVCMTKAQWAEQSKDAKENLSKVQVSGSLTPQ